MVGGLQLGVCFGGFTFRGFRLPFRFWFTLGESVEREGGLSWLDNLLGVVQS